MAIDPITRVQRILDSASIVSFFFSLALLMNVTILIAKEPLGALFLIAITIALLVCTVTILVATWDYDVRRELMAMK